VDISAIKNTNTKIVMNLPLMEDFETIGSSFALSPDQIQEISKLGNGEAIVKQSTWLEAVAVKVSKFDEKNEFRIKKEDLAAYNSRAQARTLGCLCEEIYRQYRTGELDVEKMKSILNGSSFNKWKRREYEQLLDRTPWKELRTDKKKMSAFYMELIGCRGMFETIPLQLDKKSDGARTLSKNEKFVLRQNRIRAWDKKISKVLDKYAAIEDANAKKDILTFLIYYKAMFENLNVYKLYFGLKMRQE
jgi:hypothetical protein